MKTGFDIMINMMVKLEIALSYDLSTRLWYLRLSMEQVYLDLQIGINGEIKVLSFGVLYSSMINKEHRIAIIQIIHGMNKD